MNEITRTKRLEVAHYYLLGYTYREIEEETGISHGSIANIVSEIENSALNIPGTSFDQINDLRQLSSDLKKSGLKPSQTLLGITFLQRLQSFQITPEHLEAWSELIKKLLPPDFPVNEFFESARRLHDLETSQDKSFETITEEYKSNCQRIEKLKGEADSLNEAKSQLSNEIKPLSSQLETLKQEKVRLENDVQIQSAKAQELKSRLKEAEAKGVRDLVREKSILNGEIKELEKKKGILLGEIDNSISSTSQRIKAITQEATSQIQEQVTSIRNQFDSLLVDAVNTGVAVGEMRQMVKKGEDSEKGLGNFIREVRDRFEVK